MLSCHFFLKQDRKVGISPAVRKFDVDISTSKFDQNRPRKTWDNCHSVVTKPGRFTLFLNNTNPNTILLSIGTIPIQFNTMQYLSVLTTIHPNIRMSTVWCKVMCGLLLQLWKKCTWFIKCTKKHFVLWDYWGTV